MKLTRVPPIVALLRAGAFALACSLFASSCSHTAAVRQPAVEIVESAATTPAPQVGRPRFHELHESFLARAKEGPVGVLFLGDSITYGWRNAPEVWERFWGEYQPANFGIGSDRTQNVLWRIEQGELDGISPKVVVLMIGTNNSGSDTAGQILAGQTKIVRLIREKLPRTKVLVLSIFPRGPRNFDENGVPRDDGVTRMRVIDAVNAGLPELDDGRHIRVLNINSVFLGPDGRIPDSIMYDQLHLTAEGYGLWAEAMRPTLEKMMK